MAFTDYLDLRTAVIEEVGDDSIADVFDRLTKLAEARFNRNLRTHDQITSASVTFASGVASLPSDFLEAIGLFDSNGFEYVQVPLQETQTSDRDTYYAVQGSTLVTQAADGNRTLKYYAALTTITSAMTASNWLLAGYPSVYLHGVAVEALKHLRRVDDAIALTRLADMAMNEVRIDDSRYRYSRTRVRVGGHTP